MLRRELRDVVGIECNARQRWRDDGIGLRRRCGLAGHVAGGHGALLDRVNRFAVDAIQEEQQAVLRAHGHRGHGCAADAGVEQQRRSLQVVVPDVVVNDLEVPQVAAGASVGGDERAAEEIVAVAIAAVAVEGGSGERHVEDAALGVDGHEAPDVDAGAPLGAVALPGVGKALARARHAMKRPHERAGARIPRPHVARGAARRKLLHGTARDHEVVVDERRRGHAVEARIAALQDLRRRELHDAVVPERRRERARRCVERDEPAIARTEEESRRRRAVAGPVFEAAQRRLPGPGIGVVHSSRPVVASSATTRA